MSKHRVDEEGMAPLDKGRKRYHEKDYETALACFQEAVEVCTRDSPSLLLTALDHRAAAYEKLNKLQAALRDSKQMIDLKPDASKGYLRCAKILQLKGENELALKIYQRGLSKVKITSADDERQKLQSLYNKLRQAQNPGKSLDPLEFLPIELAQMIIKNLGMRDRVICLAVTKSWKRLLESSHKLWTTFDSRSTRKPISFTALKAHLKRSNYTLDRAIISTKANFDVKRFEFLFRTCQKLSSLEICGSGVIGDTLVSALAKAKGLETIICGINCEISVATVQAALRICRETLREATFLKVKGSQLFATSTWPELQHLRTLNLRSSAYFSILNLEALRDSIPNIKSLTLTDWNPADSWLNDSDLRSLKHLQSLKLINSKILIMPSLPPSLTDLKLCEMRSLGHILTDPETYDLPLLESFDCAGTAISNVVVKEVTLQAIKAGTLKRLCVGDRLATFNPGTPVEDEFPASNSVEELSLASLIIREKRILEIVQLYPNLQRLDVSGTKITGVAVKQFVQMGIRWLKMDECIDVSPDAVDYARGKGVEVQFNFPSRSGRVASFRDASYTGVF